MLRTRKISSVELTKLFLERLNTLGPKYNALAELTPDLALEQARRADQRLHRAGAVHPGAVRQGKSESPLLGIPYGAKDLLATKNVPTRWGSPAHREQVFDYDATAIRKMEEAGAVLIGKLAMVEIAGGGSYEYPNASLHGPGLNPWNLKHWSGGSSSGSGSAVAAGLVPFALGSETWGSIVTPSTYCGITGLRPSFGVVSRYGAMELAWSMDKIGPMARSAEDCGWILQAIAGRDPNDWTTIVERFTFKPRGARKTWRLGILPTDLADAPDVADAFNESLLVLRKAGIKIAEAKLPDYAFEEPARTILNGEMAAAHEEFFKSARLDELVDPAQKKGMRKSLEVTAAAYVDAIKKREQMKTAVLAVFDEFDALVSPSLRIEAVTLETNLQTAFKKRGGYSVLGALFGVPNLTVPMGFGKQGLPLGFSFTGNLFSENTLLQLGRTFQRETDWHKHHPRTPLQG
jgi:Asp-tRNA(Asn)/Glu-tRNA(Gln) amidotransferase A subunit family amidase